jgi:hypothetical protein
MMASSVQSGGAIIFFVCLGTWLSATDLSSGIATGVSDRFAAQVELKAQGEAFEQQSYLEDEALALRTSAGCADQSRHRRARSDH